MPSAMELVTGQVAAPGTTYTNVSPSDGNTFTVRNTAIDSNVYLIDVWTQCQGNGSYRIRSPRLHDNVTNILMQHGTGVNDHVYPRGIKQKLVPQDTLDVELTGSATAGDLEGIGMLIFYEDLPGINARLAKWADIKDRIRHVIGFPVSLNFGTAGGYSGEVVITQQVDILKANEDYALLGYICSGSCLAVRFRGVDTGNLGVGGPGLAYSPRVTSRYFADLSDILDLPTIPIFNSANKNAILIDGVQDENGAGVTVTIVMAELAPAG